MFFRFSCCGNMVRGNKKEIKNMDTSKIAKDVGHLSKWFLKQHGVMSFLIQSAK